MATLNEALAAKRHAFNDLASTWKIEPVAVGIVNVGQEDFGLKITLPRTPAGEVPPQLGGVPVQYFVIDAAPQMLSAKRSRRASSSNR